MPIGRIAAVMVALWSSCTVASAADVAQQPVITTASGPVQGATSGGVAAFKNIPYAAPPVGDLRWRAPEAAPSWEEVRDASAFGNDCMQNRMSWDKAMSSQPTSEDCLYLNVWTPRAEAGARLPVMVWIHGGGFASGSGSSPMTLGDSLAARGVVVVTFNYRLGRFGFFAHPALTAEAGDASVGNYAFMDQIAALQWVQRNIAAFGGDPARVTIFGQSAGGDAVNHLMLSEAARGLFAAAISQSGGGRALWPSLQEGAGDRLGGEAAGEAFAKSAGLKQVDAAALRALPAKKVLGDISLLDNEKKTWSGAMIDGRIIRGGVAEGFAAQRQARVPYMVGATDDELGAIPGFLRGPITRELMPRLGASVDAVIAAYGARSVFDRHFASDFNFVEPARYLAGRAAAAGQPTWLYRLSYVTESKRKSLDGMPHALDVAYVFNTLEASGDRISDADREAAKRIGDIWIAFASAQAPRTPGESRAWVPYSADTDLLYDISADGVRTAPAGPDGVKAITQHFIGGQTTVLAAATEDDPAQDAAPAAETDCDRLAATRLDNGTIKATHKVAPPDTIDIGLRGVPPLPVQAAYCRVEATLHAADDGSSIRAEVWLPPKDVWNGRFIGAGNAGYGGDFTSGYLFMGGAVARGYAAASNDTGHVGASMGETSDAGAAWALDAPHKLLDYGHRANHATAVAAKRIIAAYYGDGPKRSYFQGCSNGGREALQVAHRYPDDYDGIIAGAPANPWTRMIGGFAWNATAVAATPGGLPDAKLALITDTVNAQCDALDGVEDGVLENPLQCRFDPASLRCDGDDAPDCLTAAQVDLVKKIYQGPVGKDGKPLYPGFPPGQEATQWSEWITGPASKQAFFSTEYFRYIVFGKPEWELDQLDFAKDVALGQRVAGPILDAGPDLGAFMRRGGKLILWHGWADAAISPLGTIEYHGEVRSKVGAKLANASMRMYLVPGMAHCLGGPGPNDFDLMPKLEAWVERGEPPKEIIASKYAIEYARILGIPPGEPLRTRPLCPYPQVAKWNGEGSTDEAENFSCAVRGDR
jgi:carboxylesterase type B